MIRKSVKITVCTMAAVMVIFVSFLNISLNKKVVN